MNYEKQTFVNGQVLTAECLNRMEEGIKGACEAVPPVCDSADCSKVLSYGKNGPEWVDMPEGGGNAKVHVGADAPTDENVTLWVDTSEEASGSSGCNCPPIMVVNLEAADSYTMWIYEMGSDPEGIPDRQIEFTSLRADKTYDEIRTAIESGTIVLTIEKSSSEVHHHHTAAVTEDEMGNPTIELGTLKPLKITDFVNIDTDTWGAYPDIPENDPYLWYNKTDVSSYEP